MSVCRGCGKEIVWAINKATGAKIPLDARPLVYEVIEHDLDGTPIVERAGENAMVTHFATCPKANDFSGSKRERKLV